MRSRINWETLDSRQSTFRILHFNILNDGRNHTKMSQPPLILASQSPRRRELLAEAGFTSVEVSRVEGDPLNAYYLCRY